MRLYEVLFYFEGGASFLIPIFTSYCYPKLFYFVCRGTIFTGVYTVYLLKVCFRILGSMQVFPKNVKMGNNFFFFQKKCVRKFGNKLLFKMRKHFPEVEVIEIFLWKP